LTVLANSIWMCVLEIPGSTPSFNLAHCLGQLIGFPDSRQLSQFVARTTGSGNMWMGQ